MNADPLRRVDPQRAVENVVPQRAVAVAAGGRRGFPFRRITSERIGARHDEGRRIALAHEVAELRDRRRPADRFLPEVLVDGRLRRDDEIDVLGGLSHQREQNSALFGLFQDELLVIGIDIGLHDRHPDRALRLAIGSVHRQRDGRRHDESQRRSRPAAPASGTSDRLEHEQVRHEYPKRSAERARPLVPLHEPDILCEGIAEHQPRERNLAVDKQCLIGDPAAHKHRTGQRPARAPEYRMIDQKHDRHLRGADDRSRHHADHGRIAHPPDRRQPPQHEGRDDVGPESARLSPPAGLPRKRVLDPQQRHESHEQRQRASPEPRQREQQHAQQRIEYSFKHISEESNDTQR